MIVTALPSSLTTAALALALLAGCSAPDEPNEPVTTTLPAPADYAQQLFIGTNAERTQAGLEPLAWSECIVPIAQEWAQGAAGSEELAHAPLTATCNEGATAGENLSRAAEPPQQIVDRWMASPGHQANILNEAFVEVGIACVQEVNAEATAAAEPDGVGPMTCSWVAEGLSPNDPAYTDPGTGPISIE